MKIFFENEMLDIIFCVTYFYGINGIYSLILRHKHILINTLLLYLALFGLMVIADPLLIFNAMMLGYVNGRFIQYTNEHY